MPDQQPREFTFILPRYADGLGWSCAHDWCDGKPSFQCGCPPCLDKQGLTLVYYPEDWREKGELESIWRRRIVSLRTGRLAKHLIVPEFPGSEPPEREEPVEPN